ncbi:MAG: TadE/TadG family type IV pilus assembly protein [Anaerolineae bacterium]
MERTNSEQTRGQSLVEFALVLPVLLLVLLGLVDFGRVYYVTVSLYDAAAEGAAYAAVHPDDLAEIRVRAQDATSQLVTLQADDVSDPVFAANPPQPGTPVTVTVSYDFQFYTPVATMFFPDGTVTLRGEAVTSVITGQ